MDIIDVISLTAGFTSLFMGAFAIWISLHQKKEADKINAKTIDLLIEIKTDASIVSKIAIPELQEYGKSMRRLIFRESDTESQHNIENIGNKIEVAVSKNYQQIQDQIKEFKREINKNNTQSETSIEFNRFKEKLKQLELFTNLKGEDVLRDIKEITDDIEIDLSNIGLNKIKVSYGYFDSLSDLLNSLYLDYLEKYVPIWTYGKSWVLKNNRTGKEILKNGGKQDNRSLKSLGIIPGDKLIFSVCNTNNS